MSRAAFEVLGVPAPKGSRTFLGRGASRESSEKCKPWVEAVAAIARIHRPAGRTLEPPYRVELGFSLPEPQRPKWGWPTRDGDLDKLVRAVLDGLVQGQLLLDDRHVTYIGTEKNFGEAKANGVFVVVR